MRFDIPVPCFYGRDDFETALIKIKSLGFDAVETYNWQNLDLDRVRGICTENNITFVSMCTTEFRLTDAAYRTAWLDGLKETVAAAKRAGVNKLITQVGNDTGAPRAEQHENIVTTLKMAKPILEDSGITVMIEPLNHLYDHKGYYLWSSLEAFDIIREVDCEFVKVIYDIYHQQITEGNIINNIRDNLDCIAHLHCAGHPGRHELQLGENDYKVIFAEIDKMGYDGYCGLEYGPTMSPEESLNKFKEIYL